MSIRNIIFTYYCVTLQHRLGANVRVMILSFVKHLKSRFLTASVSSSQKQYLSW